jgi:WD40 repeat protein
LSNRFAIRIVWNRRDQPIHLYDAYTGGIRASYCPYNALDEMESPMVVTFSPDGQKILGCGFRTDRTIFSFDSTRPGRDAVAIYKLGKTRRSSDGQKGLISSIDFQQPNLSPTGNRIFAVGTYSPGSIYVYDDRIISATQQPTGTILTGACIVGHGKRHYRKKRRFMSLVDSDKRPKSDYDVDTDETNDWIDAAKNAWFQRKTQGGVSQLRFAPTNEYYLYSASRRANTVLAWDLRMLSGIDEYQTNPVLVMKSYETWNDTNQRIEFDFNCDTGNTLYVGGQDNCVRVYDVSTGNLKARMEGFDDVVSGVSFFRGFANNGPLLATASGSRYFPNIPDSEQTIGFEPSVLPESRPQGMLSLFSITAE